MEELNMTFAGCGFLGLYYAGVSICFQKYASHLRFKHVSGASAGAIAACGLICNLNAEEYINDMLDLVLKSRRQILGPFSPSFNLNEALKEKLESILPLNAHVQTEGRLRVSLTRVRDGKNVVISSFESREELIDCLLASSFVPLFSGLFPPKFRGVRYIDGMFTDNLPRLQEDTITVSPFCGESDICPQGNSTPFFHINFSNTSIAMSLQNFCNFSTIVWPPRAEILAEFCKVGFDDTLRFLQRNNYISCTTCLSIQSTYVISEQDNELEDYDPQCYKCAETRQEVVMAGIPDVIESIFQGYIDSANKGLYNWLLSRRGMRVVSFLVLPYTLPIDFAYAFIVKVKHIFPRMVGNLKTVSRFVIQELLSVLQKMSGQAGYKLSATLKMEYDIGSEAKHGGEKQIKIDFRLNDKNLDISKLKSEVLSRRGSLAQIATEEVSEALGDLLEVTTRHESVMAFYYTDGNNQIQVTEIYDVSDCKNQHNSEALPRPTSDEETNVLNDLEAACGPESAFQ